MGRLDRALAPIARHTPGWAPTRVLVKAAEIVGNADHGLRMKSQGRISRYHRDPRHRSLAADHARIQDALVDKASRSSGRSAR